ncbi:hypothetical protein DUI87_03325 [Hirundo rustica rustica]|uniref:ribonuclease H n=1 Tax=Hirundo rustica rustica TaxID=333673 RepID=A0A3M0L3Z9_HIRRU|nr:hypothetical protein DUI87_03325 [Hirundo rustica rustica]
MVILGISLIAQDSQLTVSLYKLTAEDENKINLKVWDTQWEAGRLNMEPIHIEIERPEDPIRIKQYPIPMEARESRDYFAFQWEDPNTNRKQQLRWTSLPQGFIDSPNLFGQALEKLLSEFVPVKGTKLLQYVDDLLVAGPREEDVRFTEPEVKYLGHWLTKSKKKFDPDRITGIITLPPSRTKREVRQLLGLLGYCRQWIEGYSKKDLELRTASAQNPAQFLYGEAAGVPFHDCAKVVELQTKIRPDLEEEELEEGEKWFVDGSARVIDGKRKSGYVVVDGRTREVVESRPLNTEWSA